MDRKQWEPAHEPEDLARLLVERLNVGDVEGLVELYEPNAVLALGNGENAVGTEAIRQFYGRLLANPIPFEPGEQRPALRMGDLALTSTRLVNGTVTAEVARRQPDGSWRWVIDQPVIARGS